MTQPLCRRLVLPLLAACLTSLPGCATREGSSSALRSGDGDGITEYRRIVDDALRAMAAALGSLDRVSAQTDRCRPKVLSAFSKELERLEVESIQVRARSQAMQARGDAYFENWHENLARVPDARVRQLAEQHRPELQRSFASIKRNSENTRETFKLFLSGLRKLRSTLENDPGTVGAEVTRNLIRITNERGREVELGIAAIGEELKAMKVMLTPSKAGTKS